MNAWERISLICEIGECRMCMLGRNQGLQFSLFGS
jgi:hypothetical protein